MTIKKQLSALSRAAFVILLSAIAAFGQDVPVPCRVESPDPTGASVPGARIDLINEQTDVTVNRSSTEDGTYIFNLVPPGRYTVRVSSTGFQNAVLTGVTVEVNKATRRCGALRRSGVGNDRGIRRGVLASTQSPHR